MEDEPACSRQADHSDGSVDAGMRPYIEGILLENSNPFLSNVLLRPGDAPGHQSATRSGMGSTVQAMRSQRRFNMCVFTGP